MNIGQERDFYAVKDITDNEIEYISAISKNRHGGVLDEHNSRFIDLYKKVSALHSSKEADNKIEELLIQFEEDFMSVIEADGITYLKLLLVGNSTFFNDYKNRAKFCYFIMIQFVRTKRMSEKIKSALRNHLAEKSIRVDNVWAVEKYIDAGHMALSLFSEKQYKVHLLNNATEEPFITGDQPIFNIKAIGLGDKIPTEVEFYYPISPLVAVIVSKNTHQNEVDLEAVQKFNSFVKEMSYEQIYANKEEFL